MNYKVEEVNGIHILRIHEERLDTSVAPDLKAELMALAQKGLQQNILIDLKAVDYADSSGLGAILFGIRQARETESQLKLMHTNVRVMNLIRIAKLDNIIDFFDNEQEAIDSFSN
ncbi:MAG: STAS domain-containing protein [Deferribacteres bacterium]|nr:STAS domain-containing protein [candidate division KSB1 bacterium]MCB9504355.1 STAS domain-containing protein [Deferribacteres bacterium]